MLRAVAKAAAAQKLPDSDTILQSPLDKRIYRRLVLDNGMTVLLISDPEMAAAISNVGEVRK
jgi:secreted Zn-dependent insulinase-like peptidase